MSEPQTLFHRASVAGRAGVALGQSLQQQQPSPTQLSGQTVYQQAGYATSQQQQHQQHPPAIQSGSLQQSGPIVIQPPPDPPFFVHLSQANVQWQNAIAATVNHTRTIVHENARLRRETQQAKDDGQAKCQSLWYDCESARVKADDRHAREKEELKEQHATEVNQLGNDHVLEFCRQTREANEVKTGLCLTIRKVEKNRDDLRAALAEKEGAHETAISDLKSECERLQNTLTEEQTAKSVLHDTIEKQSTLALAQSETAKDLAAKSLLRTACFRYQIKQLQAKSQTADFLLIGFRMQVTRLEGELSVAHGAVDDLELHLRTAEAKAAGLEDRVKDMQNSIDAKQVENENLQAKLSRKEEACSVFERKYDAAIDNHSREKAALAKCEKDRKTEVAKNKNLVASHSELKEIVRSQNDTLGKRDIALAEKDTELENLREACDVLQKQLKWAEGRNVDLSEEKVTAVQEAIKEIEDNFKQTEMTLEQEKSALKAQVEQLQQDLQIVREAQEEAQDGYAAAQQKLEEYRELELAEDEIKMQRKRLLNGDSIGAPALKRPRVSTEMTPPKSPTPKTDQEAILPTPATALMTPPIKISLKTAKSSLSLPPPGPSNQARRPATPKSPARFVGPRTPGASSSSATPPPPQPPMKNKDSSLPPLQLNSVGNHRPPKAPRNQDGKRRGQGSGGQ